MTPRVLFLNHSASMGGAEFCLLDIAANLKDSSVAVLLEDGPLADAMRDAGVPVRALDGGAIHAVRRDSRVPGLSALRGVWRLAREVATIAADYDVIHANSQKALVVGSLAARRAGVPLVWHLHDIIEPPWFSRVNVMADTFLANHFVDRVLTVSHAAAKTFVRQGGKSQRVHVVYNGIDVSKFGGDEPDTRALRDTLGLPDAPLVGCFSRLAAWKGQHILIRALKRIPDAHVLLVGGALFDEHEYEASLRQMVKVLGLESRVHFLGHRADVAALMRSVDYVVHPSTAPEPFARTLIEAMLAGKPPIASACGGVPELIEDGVTGYLFPPGNATALTRILSRLLSGTSEISSVARAGRERAMADFALPRFVGAVAAHLEAVAVAHAPAMTPRMAAGTAS